MANFNFYNLLFATLVVNFEFTFLVCGISHFEFVCLFVCCTQFASKTTKICEQIK